MTHLSLQSALLFVFIISLLLDPAISADPLFHFCFSKENYTAASPYDINLNALTTRLNFVAPQTGFATAIAGQDSNTVFGLALCRGDVKMPDCLSCLASASEEIRRECPSSKGAVIWYDNCMLKYSDEKFAGAIDEVNKFYMYNTQCVEENAGSFNAETKAFLGGLADKAYGKDSLFATGEMDRSIVVKDQDSRRLYGLVQCSRDLDRKDCGRCLHDAIREINSCCNEKRGGRVVSPSCNFRYELYPFFNAADRE